MVNKFEELGCEFKNSSECEEELDEIGRSSIEEEKLFFDQDEISKNAMEEKATDPSNKFGIMEKNGETLKRDEVIYEDLVEEGVEEKEAAHIVNRATEKRLKSQNIIK